ncbi:MAG: AmmeMemoRadiSam system radical SAM enzyme [Deltaproteobacteria bacterium]|nr:AmmeMemoRadiSam system radical SAM enzyme [Deltaproteobacteria bacterium]
MKEALLYEKADGRAVICNLCAHRCFIPPGRVGICHVRENRAGVLYTLVYDRVISLNIDPIEKKPFFHFLPGTRSYSIATVGCNFHCRFCQNWEISQMAGDRNGLILGEKTSPEEIVRGALQTGCKTIAYTYTEPTIFFELAYDAARLAVNEGLRNLFVTNGYITPEALRMIQPYLHGANLDLKGFDDRRYRRVCGAKLQPVLDTIRLMKELGIWVEVTTLVVPGHNDSDQELRQIAIFLREVGAEIPWHLSAFFPAYKMLDVEPTDRQTLMRAWAIGKEAGLRHVYIGNLADNVHEDTTCYQCGNRLVQRFGFTVRRNLLDDGRCPFCHASVEGVWKNEFLKAEAGVTHFSPNLKEVIP